MSFNQTMIYVVGAASGLTAVAVCFRKVLWPMLLRVHPIARWIADMADLPATVRLVRSELTTNGGASLKDAVLRMESTIALTEQRHIALVIDSPDAKFEADVNGDTRWVNRTYCRLTGQLPEQLTGSGWVNTVAPRDRDRVADEWECAVTEGREFSTAYLIERPDGERVHVRCRTYVMRDCRGSVIGYSGTLTILDQHHADDLPPV
jgi:PAS domain S-box-containing protein